MSTGALAVTAAGIALLIRQVFVLAGVARSRRFLASSGTADTAGEPTIFAVVVPALQEATIIAETTAHMRAVADAYAGQLVVVTTAREDAEPGPDAGPWTAARVADLAAGGKLTHLHYPDPTGLKADQLNHAAAHCAATTAAERAFLVCYDADSRPPIDSLASFAHTIAKNPEADVFHQSSRFELRRRLGANRHGGWTRTVCDGGALRANRFVLGFELPRLLNRTPSTGSWKGRACSYVYAHVTGHGLCIRLSTLRRLPLPAQSPLEDMHYSFILCSRNAPMVPVPSLDRAEVPDTMAGQIQQAARWFSGPGRALRYVHDSQTQPGPRSWILAASALGSAVEWLGCALVPPLLLAASWYAYPAGLAVSAAVATVYGVQLLLTETTLGSHDLLRRRTARIVACPVAAILFGVGGLVGAARLARGGTGAGKTERR